MAESFFPAPNACSYSESSPDASPGASSCSCACRCWMPLGLLSVAFVIMVLFQVVQIVQDRENLKALAVQQAESLANIEKVRVQFGQLATGVARLAAQGNKNAQRVVDELRAAGVNGLEAAAKEPAPTPQEQPATDQPAAPTSN